MFSRDLGFHYLLQDLKTANTGTLLFDEDFRNTEIFLKKEADITHVGTENFLDIYNINGLSYLYVCRNRPTKSEIDYIN